MCGEVVGGKEGKGGGVRERRRKGLRREEPVRTRPRPLSLGRKQKRKKKTSHHRRVEDLAGVLHLRVLRVLSKKNGVRFFGLFFFFFWLGEQERDEKSEEVERGRERERTSSEKPKRDRSFFLFCSSLSLASKNQTVHLLYSLISASLASGSGMCLSSSEWAEAQSLNSRTAAAAAGSTTTGGASPPPLVVEAAAAAAASAIVFDFCEPSLLH